MFFVFYDQIKKLCKINNVKITNVIIELGLSTGGVSRWQNGVTPTGETLQKFSEYFDVSIDYLMENERFVKKAEEPVFTNMIGHYGKGEEAIEVTIEEFYELKTILTALRESRK